MAPDTDEVMEGSIAYSVNSFLEHPQSIQTEEKVKHYQGCNRIM